MVACACAVSSSNGAMASSWAHSSARAPSYFCSVFSLPHMAAVSQRPATTTTAELQSSGDLHLGISNYVESLVNEVLAWQTRKAAQSIPCGHCKESEERKLGLRFQRLLIRRYKAVGKEASRSQLSPCQADLVNSVPGVPLHGCCLLYTSPSPRDGLLSRMPSSA